MRTRTSQLALNSARTMLDPMNPVPPVTSARIRSSVRRLIYYRSIAGTGIAKTQGEIIA